jgi:xanthine dehydrogenase accessory factor
MIVVGGGDLAVALEGQAGLLGWQAMVASSVETVEGLQLGPTDAMIVLSHDPLLDTPALAAALASPAGYVGALGSRHTQAGRRERLLAGGVDEDALGRIRGPAGLDLGSRTPAEIALAISAEILALRSGRLGGALRDRAAPINA